MSRERKQGKSVSIDWDAVHRRLEVAREAIEREADPSEQVREDVLRDRAKALARPLEDGAVAAEWLEVVCFELAHETYGLESALVHEVVPLKELTPLPCVPAFVRGIINVRGHIVSVIDIKTFFGLPERGITDLNRVLILRQGRMEFGILADRILGAERVALGDLQTGLATLTGVRADYLRGVTPDRRVILDATRLLNDPALIVDEEVG